MERRARDRLAMGTCVSVLLWACVGSGDGEPTEAKHAGSPDTAADTAADTAEDTVAGEGAPDVPDVSVAIGDSDSSSEPPSGRLLDAGPADAAAGVLDAAVFEPGSFAAMHQDEIVTTCRQTVDCYRQRSDAALPDDPYRLCERNTAEVLNASPERQGLFLANVRRCAEFGACMYVECANSP